MQPILTGNENQVFNVLGNFLVGILPPTVEVVRGEENRVPEPTVPDFVVMWPLSRHRLATNASTYTDIAFTGSISGTTLTVTQMLAGTIVAGLTIIGTGITDSTLIQSQLTGTPGGVGTYQVSITQTVTSTTIQAGTKNVQSSIERVFQLDVHGPNSADNAQVIQTLWRDSYAVTQFETLVAALNPGGPAPFDLAPLYANDPRQMPFLNAEQQYEIKWMIEAALQINPTVQVQQQFASALAISLNEVP